MLWTIGVILLILWLLGLITAHTFGGVIHVLLVIALVVIVVRLIQGRRVWHLASRRDYSNSVSFKECSS